MVSCTQAEAVAEHSGAGDDRVVFRPDARTTRACQEAPTWTLTWTSSSSDPLTLLSGLVYHPHSYFVHRRELGHASAMASSRQFKFLGLTPMDMLHRTFVFGLAGMACYGVFMMGAIHFDTMKRGKGVLSLLYYWSATWELTGRDRNVEVSHSLFPFRSSLST